MAACLTVAMTLGLTLFACCCKMKLSVLWAICAGGTVNLLPLIIFAVIFPNRLIFQVASYCFTVLAAIYIVFDTKLILTKLEVDDYIIAALVLYTDIIDLFIWILSILGGN